MLLSGNFFNVFANDFSTCLRYSWKAISYRSLPLQNWSGKSHWVSQMLSQRTFNAFKNVWDAQPKNFQRVSKCLRCSTEEHSTRFKVSKMLNQRIFSSNEFYCFIFEAIKFIQSYLTGWIYYKAEKKVAKCMNLNMMHFEKRFEMLNLF